MKSKTCCFSGPRILPKENIKQTVIRLDCEIDRLICQGVTDFISGGVLGFDLIVTSLIVVKREIGRNIRLIFALPYKNHDIHWNADQRKLYRSLLTEADEIVYVSEENYNGCIKKHSRYIVDHSSFCLCAFPHPYKETNYTIKYALKEGMQMINTVN